MVDLDTLSYVSLGITEVNSQDLTATTLCASCINCPSHKLIFPNNPYLQRGEVYQGGQSFKCYVVLLLSQTCVLCTIIFFSIVDGTNAEKRQFWDK